jgi:hypothetical protein
VALALAVATLGQAALMVGTATSEPNDASGARLTPATAPNAQESVAALSKPNEISVRLARIDDSLEQQKREAMERNVEDALDTILARREAERQAALAALATPEPTPEPVVETTTAEPTTEPTPEPTPEATATPDPATLEAPSDQPLQPNSYYLSEEFLRPYFGDNWQKASQVVNCESGGNPTAVYADENGQPLYVGLFQIYVGNWGGKYSPDMLKDPHLNAELAAELSGRGADFAGNWPSCGAGL